MWILSKGRRNKRNLMLSDENTKMNGYISARKRSSGILNTFGVPLCRNVLRFGTGNYITRAICKLAFEEAADKSNPTSSSGTNSQPRRQPRRQSSFTRLTRR